VTRVAVDQNAKCLRLRPTLVTPSAQKILLIDDDATMAEMIGFMVTAFRRGPFVVEHRADFAGGLKSLLTGDYVLCLLDYHLGERDGLELLREAKAQHCPTPVILLTGSSREETDLAAMDGGAVDFMEKIELNPRGLERAVYYALKMSAAMAQLRNQAAHDELTGVVNRREFDRRLLEEWQRSIRFARPLSLVMIDLDRFKVINDTHGHPVGDEVLRHVAGLLSAQIRQVDCLARYGGDEFVLLLVETDLTNAKAVAARLRELVVRTPCRIESKNLTIDVGFSAGVAAWPDNADKLSALVAAADADLYDSKRRGPNGRL
jgi:two-component system cell cycle response regulator